MNPLVLVAPVLCLFLPQAAGPRQEAVPLRLLLRESVHVVLLTWRRPFVDDGMLWGPLGAFVPIGSNWRYSKCQNMNLGSTLA